jgi:hypothetical protein
MLPSIARCQEILTVEIDADTANLMTKFTVVMSAPRSRNGAEVLIQNDDRTFKATRRIAPSEMTEKRMTCELSMLAPFDTYRITFTDDEPPFFVSTKRLVGKLAAEKASILPWLENPDHQDAVIEKGETGGGIASFHLSRSKAAKLLIVVFDAEGQIADQYYGLYPARRSWTSRLLPSGSYHFAMAGADRSGNPVEVKPEGAFLELTP